MVTNLTASQLAVEVIFPSALLSGAHWPQPPGSHPAGSLVSMSFDDHKIYFEAVTESQADRSRSPAGSYCAGTLEQARAFAQLALGWKDVDQVRIGPFSVRAEVPIIGELHERDGVVTHFDGDWKPGPWPAEVLAKLDSAVLS
ncbi:hypothetical protein GCM10010442_23130 [Kitasatospora kifunensis]